MNFMAGRYGLDSLGKFTLAAALVIMVLNMFLRIDLLNILEWALLIVTIFRMFSKNHSKRAEENNTYMQYSAKVKKWFSSRGRIEDKQKGKKTEANQSGQSKQSGPFSQAGTQQDDSVCIFVCPTCGTKLRVPKGKGKIQITCPVCKNSFIDQS